MISSYLTTVVYETAIKVEDIYPATEVPETPTNVVDLCSATRVQEKLKVEDLLFESVVNNHPVGDLARICKQADQPGEECVAHKEDAETSSIKDSDLLTTNTVEYLSIVQDDTSSTTGEDCLVVVDENDSAYSGKTKQNQQQQQLRLQQQQQQQQQLKLQEQQKQQQHRQQQQLVDSMIKEVIKKQKQLLQQNHQQQQLLRQLQEESQQLQKQQQQQHQQQQQGRPQLMNSVIKEEIKCEADANDYLVLKSVYQSGEVVRISNQGEDEKVDVESLSDLHNSENIPPLNVNIDVEQNDENIDVAESIFREHSYSSIQISSTAQFGKNQSSVKNTASKKKFPCLFLLCQKEFTSNRDLVRHTRTHTGEKPHRCSVCDVAFAGKSNMVAHMRTHTGEKPFKCPHCDKSFSWNTSLKCHIRTHTGEKPYTCTHPNCTKSYINNSHLKRHMRGNRTSVMFVRNVLPINELFFVTTVSMEERSCSSVRYVLVGSLTANCNETFEC